MAESNDLSKLSDLYGQDGEPTIEDARRDVRALVAEVAYLRERVAAAEQVATIFGWTGSDSQTETGKAATQAWMDWSHVYGSPSPSPEWNARIAVLARRRDQIVAATLRRLRAGGQIAPEEKTNV